MKKIIGFIAGLGILFSIGCGDERTSNHSHVESEVTEDTLHTAETSLDIPGVYEGIFECADCDGIHVVLTISEDKTYKQVTTYVGNETNDFEMPGKWEIQKNTMTLTDSTGKIEKYYVGENYIQAMDSAGNPMIGEQNPDEFKLKKKKPTS